MKLLDRTLRTYLLYSVVVILISTPVFYLVIERLFVQDLDEALLLRKATIQQKLGQFTSLQQLLAWRDLEGNTELRPLTAQMPLRDSLYDAFYTQPEEADSTEVEAFRELSARLRYRGQPVLLITRISVVENEDLLQAVVLTQLGLLLFLLVGLLLLNRYIARRLWHPFYQTLGQLQQFDVAKAEPLHLSPSPISEFTQLNLALNELTRRSHQVYLGQKEFTENAAHELQTPLAIFQSKLERLSQTQPLTHEQADLIGSLNAGTVRLGRLNKSLLILARLENHHPGELRPLNLATLLSTLLPQFDSFLEVKDLTLERTGIQDGPIVQASPSLLDILLTNLLTNAIRYTHRGGQIGIDLQPQRLTITNPGEALDIPAEKLFARFQKGNDQRGGVGLGLAIAKKIADTSGYSLTYHYEEGQHQFVIGFDPGQLVAS